MGIDANARSPLWNSRHLDAKGKELEGLLTGSVLGLANKQLGDLAFNPPGTTFIDVTLHGCNTDVVDWRYLDLPSLSDHPLIYFRSRVVHGHSQHMNSTSTAGPLKSKRVHLPPAQSIDLLRYTTAMNAALCSPPILLNDVNIDHCVDELEAKIQSSARRFGYYRGVAHLISHGSVREKYLLSFNRESEKSEKKVRNFTCEIFLMVHPGKEWATPRLLPTGEEGSKEENAMVDKRIMGSPKQTTQSLQ